jgi:hypothetical protein
VVSLADITLQRISAEFEGTGLKIVFKDDSRPALGSIPVTVTPKKTTPSGLQTAIDEATDKAITQFAQLISDFETKKVLRMLGKSEIVYKGDLSKYDKKVKA